MSSKAGNFLRWFLIGLVVIAIAVFSFVWKPAIDPLPAVPDGFTDEQLERGKNVAAAGVCVVCHTAPDGQPNAGGLPMETPFGTIYSTNITTDLDKGIGNWSFEAFDRAMRRGIARDGSYLYPAFPYTHFTHLTDEDMKALYAHMMTQPAVNVEPPKTELPFPLNMRPLMAGWNLLFLRRGPIERADNESEEWNRGLYLTRGAGHCAACHSPRNALGAEKSGENYLSGGEAEGWIAPALNDQPPAPVPWTQEALFAYLRYGFAGDHGAAGGPMAPVVREGTAKMAEADTRALAVYLASLNAGGEEEEASDRAGEITEKALLTLSPPLTEGARLFNSACLACHHAGNGPTLFGVQPKLWLSSSLYLEKPDNVVRYVLDGVHNPANPDLGYMPAFRHYLNDQQIATVVNYMRTSFTGHAKWDNLPETVSRLRKDVENE
ncbi:MAG TPA: cytochrome C [Pusillimonas sp.]|jgi:mono/diheme cytochrome c family protein|nr:cytochrome C [Pusillimonas sp.]|tara:strand:+ start:166612 stop:167919 length:1308 start_codon:yes stop_codon:yes gene_type:complete